MLVLDCGADRTSLAAWHKRRGQDWPLAEFRSEEHARKADSQTVWWEETMRALGRLKGRTARRRPVVVLLPARQVLIKLMKMPDVGTEKLSSLVDFEAKQAFPLPGAELVWDWAVTSRQAGEVVVALFAARMSRVDELCRRVEEEAGLRPIAIWPAVFPLVGAVGLRAGTAAWIVAREPGAITVVRCGPDGFLVRHCPAGADISAERVVQEIRRTQWHFDSLAVMPEPREIWLMGRVAGEVGAEETVSRMTGLPCRRLETDGVPAGVQPHAVHVFGATRQAIGSSVPDLLPSIRRQDRELRRLRPWLGASAGLALMAVLAPWLTCVNLAQRAVNERRALEQENVALTAQTAPVQTQLQLIERLKREADAWRRIHRERLAWARVLADLQERIVRSGDLWLDGLQVVPEQINPGHGGVGRTELQANRRVWLRGRMLDVDRLELAAGAEAYRRVQLFFADLSRSGLAVGVEGIRFDAEEPGILRFEGVWVLAPSSLP